MMRLISYLLMIILIITTLSCTAIKEGSTKGEEEKPRGKKTKAMDDDEYKFTPPKENIIKGTSTEIMNAFKSLLSRYEFDTFDVIKMKIVTKTVKMDQSNPNYEKYKTGAELYEKYEINMTKQSYDVIVDIKYLILAKELNPKTGVLDIKEIANPKEVGDALLEKVKRLLYGY